jgi:hypothetical protein
VGDDGEEGDEAESTSASSRLSGASRGSEKFALRSPTREAALLCRVLEEGLTVPTLRGDVGRPRSRSGSTFEAEFSKMEIGMRAGVGTRECSSATSRVPFDPAAEEAAAPRADVAFFFTDNVGNPFDANNF